jgi:hypothetical protein
MPLATLSLRSQPGNRLHHLWCNNGTWWIHFTVNFDHRTRRIRRSLRTDSLEEAICRRDRLLAQIASEGLVVADRRDAQPTPLPLAIGA